MDHTGAAQLRVQFVQPGGHGGPDLGLRGGLGHPVGVQFHHAAAGATGPRPALGFEQVVERDVVEQGIPGRPHECVASGRARPVQPQAPHGERTGLAQRRDPRAPGLVTDLRRRFDHRLQAGHVESEHDQVGGFLSDIVSCPRVPVLDPPATATAVPRRIAAQRGDTSPQAKSDAPGFQVTLQRRE